MAKKSRDKGLRNEQQLVNFCREAGLAAWRIPLSGAAGGEFSGDIRIAGRVYEAKVRASGLKTLYGWLGNNYGLLLRADRQEQLVVLRLKDYAELLAAVDRKP
jgi:hypothetical protein